MVELDMVNPSFRCDSCFILETADGSIDFFEFDPISLSKTRDGNIIVGDGRNSLLVKDTKMKRDIVNKVSPSHPVFEVTDTGPISAYNMIVEECSVEDVMSRMSEVESRSDCTLITRVTNDPKDQGK